MEKNNQISYKRQIVKKSLLKTLHVSLGGKRHKAATTADASLLQGDVPNMNVGRAFVVIALLHVFAVSGVLIHKKYFENQQQTTTSKVSEHKFSTNKIETLENIVNLPKIGKDDKRHMVSAGDTYSLISNKLDIEEQELRDANSNTPLFSGLVLRVPPKKIAVPLAINSSTSNTNSPSKAILVKPNLNVESAPRAIPINETNYSINKTYIVTKGDTIYTIAKRYKVKSTEILRINKIKNQTTLKIGTSLKIP
jgi:LysM repeat protein